VNGEKYGLLNLVEMKRRGLNGKRVHVFLDGRDIVKERSIREIDDIAGYVDAFAVRNGGFYSDPYTWGLAIERLYGDVRVTFDKVDQ
jgi:hypothetical protein